MYLLFFSPLIIFGTSSGLPGLNFMMHSLYSIDFLSLAVDGLDTVSENCHLVRKEDVHGGG